jgi:hypothetical protein
MPPPWTRRALASSALRTRLELISAAVNLSRMTD